MLDALRHRSLALAALLLLLSAVSVDLCAHGAGFETARAESPMATSLACDDCGDCCDGGAGDADHCHACLCACHSVGVLAAAEGRGTAAAASPLAAQPTPRRAPGFRAAFERPPLAS